MNLLFVCSKNRWRSRTAETIFSHLKGHFVKSAGTDEDARIKLNAKHLVWADLVFVMEKRHKQLIHQKFQDSRNKQIIILNIPDEYQYMDEELIEHLTSALSEYI